MTNRHGALIPCHSQSWSLGCRFDRARVTNMMLTAARCKTGSFGCRPKVTSSEKPGGVVVFPFVKQPNKKVPSTRLPHINHRKSKDPGSSSNRLRILLLLPFHQISAPQGQDLHKKVWTPSKGPFEGPQKLLMLAVQAQNIPSRNSITKDCSSGHRACGISRWLRE